MKTAMCCLISASLTAALAFALASAEPPGRSPRQIVESYVEDFRFDPAAAEARKFGIRVTGEGGGSWTVAVRGSKDDEGEWQVDLVDGAPGEPSFSYTTDATTLAAIDAGRINALTAAGKAFPGDPTPMEFEWMPGAKKFDANPFSFHFWTRGIPEKVPFDRNLSRVVHGCNNVVLYYEQGFRSAWASLAKGQGANNGPGHAIIVPFPTMVIVVAGEVQGTVDGKLVTAEAGEMVFIPPMTPYEWSNEKDAVAEAVLVWFGEGA